MERTRAFHDIRDTTYRNRAHLGFLPERRLWQAAPADFSPHRLTIGGHVVMEEWEASYMQTLAALAGSRGGRVLEVGFGLGLAAGFLQQQGIEAHWIIEANREVFARLGTFAAQARIPVTPLLGFWQEMTREMPEASFSGILFDTYPLSEAEIHRNHFAFFPEAFRLLRPGGVFTYYSDEIDAFSPEHRQRLHAAGFRTVDAVLCHVAPPPECPYWQSPTLLAPIVIK
jgi:guanidinoacetate N-methyltransferase